MIAALVLAGCADPDVVTGVQYYEQGEYDRSLEAFEQAGGDAPSATVLYDLGNANWKKGDLAHALAYWRNAHDRAPRDGDVSHNLALARGALSGLPDPVPPPYGWMEFITPGEVGALGTILLVVAAVGALRRRRRLAAGDDPTEVVLLWASPWLSCWVTGALLGAAALSGLAAEASRPVAVVIEPDIPVRADPVPEARPEATLPAGAEVAVEAWDGAFALVRTSEGRAGWVVGTSLALGR